MKHVVIGGGNLGLDIMQHGWGRDNYELKVFTLKRGFKYPTSLDPVLDEMPDHVWVTAGAGSVDRAKLNFTPFADLHIRLVMELAQKLPDHTWLHTFSTNYATDSTSLYSISKRTMEELLESYGRKHSRVYRVQSLYGWHKPMKTFPYKLMKNHPQPGRLTLPPNEIVPTPTSWLAKTLLDNLDKLTKYPYHNVFSLAPNDKTTACEWAQLILGDKYEVEPGDYDKDRPINTFSGCDILDNVETWRDLWDSNWNNQLSQRRRLEIQLRG